MRKKINRGIEKRLENGKGLPPGWVKKCFKNGTTTPPVASSTLPKITNIEVRVGTSTAVIHWRTNEDTLGQVFYATGTLVTASSTVESETVTSTTHTVTLDGLMPDTIYFYKIRVMDADGNVKETGTLRFHTKNLPVTPTPDTTAPQIIFSTALGLHATSTRVIWVTNEASDSKVWFSTTTPVDTSASAAASSTALVYFHNLDLPELATSTLYYFTVASADTSGNVATSTGTFTTLAE